MKKVIRLRLKHWRFAGRPIWVGFLLALLLVACRSAADETPVSVVDSKQPATREVISYAGAMPEGALARLGRGSLEVAAFSPDDQTLVVGGKTGVYQYVADTLEEIWQLPATSQILSLAFSPDGAWLAAGAANGVVNLVDVSSGLVVKGTPPNVNEQNGVYSLAWSEDPESADGLLLAVGFNDGNVTISRITSKNDGGQAGSPDIEVFGSLDRARGGMTAMEFSHNGRILAGADRYGNINLWEVATLSLFGQLIGHQADHALFNLSWSPEGDRILSGSRDGQVILWDVLTLEPLHQIDGPAEVLGLSYSPDGQSFAVAHSDGQVTINQAADPYQEESSRDVNQKIAGLAYDSGWNNFVAFTPDGELSVWPLTGEPAAQPTATLAGHTPVIAAATAQAWSPDGQILAMGLEELVILWDTTNWLPVQSLVGHESGITALAWSPDGAELASASRDNSVIIWDLESGQLRLKLAEHGRPVSDLAYSPDGQRLATAGSLDNTILSWDLEDGRVLGIYPGEGAGAWSVAWSPDGQTLATGLTSGHVHLWTADNHASPGPLTSMIRHSNWVSGLDFSPDGSLLASVGADARLLITRLEDEKAKTLSGHRGPVRRVHFSPDGTRLVTSGIDGQVIVWDARPEAETEPIFIFEGHTGPINDAGWSPDGRQVVSVSDDGTAIIWDVSTSP